MREWTQGMRVRDLTKRDVLFFTAAWCAPCKVLKGALNRRLEAVAAARAELDGPFVAVRKHKLATSGDDAKIKRIILVDVEAWPRVANAFGITAMPTIVRLSDDAQLVAPNLNELLAFLTETTP